VIFDDEHQLRPMSSRAGRGREAAIHEGAATITSPNSISLSICDPFFQDMRELEYMDAQSVAISYCFTQLCNTCEHRLFRRG
jgi:hypothetical protein